MKATVYLFLLDHHKLLLLKRANTEFEDGNYGLPAGHVESDETINATLIREANIITTSS